MKIRQKLLLSYLVIIALFIAAGATITYNTTIMSNLQSNVQQQVNINNNAYAYQQGLDQKQFGTLMYSTDQVSQGQQIMVSSAELQVKTQTFLASALASDPTLLSEFQNVVSTDSNQINPTIKAIAETYADPSLNSSDKYTQIWDQMTTLMNDTSQADAQLASVRSATQTNVQNAAEESQNYANMSITIAVIFIVAIIAASIALSVVMGRRITNPLKKLANIAQKVSQGNLDQRYYLKQNIDVKTGDEIDELADAFKKMINAFRMQEALLKEDEGTEGKE